MVLSIVIRKFKKNHTDEYGAQRICGASSSECISFFLCGDVSEESDNRKELTVAILA